MSQDVPGKHTIHLDLPARYQYLNVLGSCITEMLSSVPDLPDSTDMAASVGLAVHEICTNVIDHAYEHNEECRINITLTVTAPPRSLIVNVVDSGLPFNPAAARPPDLLEPQEHGYGLFIAHSFLDVVDYERLSETNRWHLVKHLEPEEGVL
jgi:serine/threonine-protein kinase RsbW